MLNKQNVVSKEQVVTEMMRSWEMSKNNNEQLAGESFFLIFHIQCMTVLM